MRLMYAVLALAGLLTCAMPAAAEDAKPQVVLRMMTNADMERRIKLLEPLWRHKLPKKSAASLMRVRGRHMDRMWWSAAGLVLASTKLPDGANRQTLMELSRWCLAQKVAYSGSDASGPKDMARLQASDELCHYNAGGATIAVRLLRTFGKL